MSNFKNSLNGRFCINKANILPFKKDAGFYYKLSLNSIDKGDMADAVFYLKKAVSTEESDDAYSIELAKTLSLISQYDQSNLIYIKLLADKSKEGKCCFGLSQNLYYLNDLEHSLYYLNLYMDKYSDSMLSDEEDEYIEIIEETDIYDGYQIVYPLQKQDMTDSINQARNLMKSGMFEKAKMILKKIPQGNIDYLFARNNLALCCFFLNDFTGTKAYSDEVLKLDENNVFALCNLSAMYNYIEDSKNTAVYLNRFLEVKTEELSDLFKIATTLCELKEHSLALKYLNNILSQKPYDSNIMFLTAIAYYNNKNIPAAINMFLQLIKLNEKDYAVKYYLKLIRQTQKDKDIENGFFQPLEYICQVPYGEMLSRIKKIKGLTVANIRESINEKGFLELFDWSFTLSDIKLQKLIIDRLSAIKNKKIEIFLREKLIDPLINIHIKKLIIEKFIIKAVPPKYSVCIDYVVKSLSPVVLVPEKAVKNFYHAYAIAYSTLMMFLSDSIEEDLYKAYCKVAQAGKEFQYIITDKKALSAIIAYFSKGERLVKIKKNMCKIFKADIKTVDKYLEILSGKTGKEIFAIDKN